VTPLQLKAINGRQARAAAATAEARAWTHATEEALRLAHVALTDDERAAWEALAVEYTAQFNDCAREARRHSSQAKLMIQDACGVGLREHLATASAAQAGD
jgi:hypothetical protein